MSLLISGYTWLHLAQRLFIRRTAGYMLGCFTWSCFKTAAYVWTLILFFLRYILICSSNSLRLATRASNRTSTGTDYHSLSSVYMRTQCKRRFTIASYLVSARCVRVTTSSVEWDCPVSNQLWKAASKPQLESSRDSVLHTFREMIQQDT